MLSRSTILLRYLENWARRLDWELIAVVDRDIHICGYRTSNAIGMASAAEKLERGNI